MKKQLSLTFFSIFLLLLMTSTVFAEKTSYGSQAALKDSEISLAKALTYALEDEYLAQARNDEVIKKFGHIRPFSHIKAVEQRHIQELLPFFKKYNIDVPQDVAAEYVGVPNSLNEAYQMGVDGEINTIAMYDKLASIKEFPMDIRSIFIQLRTASSSHLETLKSGLQQ